MKTRNKKSGNSNNQLSRVLLRAAAVVVSMLVLSFTVSAQDLLKEILSYNNLNEMALVLAENTSVEDPVSGQAASFTFVEETEKPLELEAWMTSDSFYGAMADFNRVEAEATLNLEPWMTDEGFYNGRFSPEKEKELKLEAWMCDSQFFNNSK